MDQGIWYQIFQAFRFLFLGLSALVNFEGGYDAESSHLQLSLWYSVAAVS